MKRTLIFANSSMAALAAAAATRGSTTLAKKATVDMMGLPKQ
jgi:hypothetical protein